jgi:hypothetical protein
MQDDSVEVSPLDDFAAFEAWRNTGEMPKSEGASESEDETTEKSESASDADTDGEDTELEGGEDEDEGDEPESEEKPRRKGGVQKKIDRLTRERRSLEAENAALKARLDGGKPTEATPAASDASDKEPNIDDFPTYEAYNRALIRYELKQDEKAKAVQAEMAKAEESQRQVLDSFNKRVAEFKATAKDFDDVLAAVEVPISPALQIAILESEVGPSIAYDLAKNPKELERINALSPLAIAREVGRLEAAKLKPAEAPKPKLSQAPKPITPVAKGGKTAAPNVYDPETANDFTKWEAARNRDLKRR